MVQQQNATHDARSVGRTPKLRVVTLMTLSIMIFLACSSAGPASAAPACDFPDSDRVDLGTPVFSNPTNITNPLFPVGTTAQVIHLGESEGEPIRAEVTLLPQTKTISLNGVEVETLVQQYIAYQDGRIVEVALDYYAQADDGAVWYFGEDVDNYEDGVIVDHEGTWLAGKDGPPGMIMPANPQVGDVYRPENIPGLVFEEDLVKKTGLTVQGPRGEVTGAIRIEECLMDGTTEGKIFAPGYGEFRVIASDETSEVALAVPIDAVGGGVPSTLETISDAAEQIFQDAPEGNWTELGALRDQIQSAWDAYSSGGVPPILESQMDDALDGLSDALKLQDDAEVRQAAINVAFAELDLELRHASVAAVDRERLEVWRWQLDLDREEGDTAGVRSDMAILKTIRNRLR